MQTVSEAESLIQSAMPRFPAESVPLAAAAGRVLREAVVADRPLPPYDRSTMDGIALRASAAALALAVENIQRAGQPGTTLQDPDASCHRIMTGAVIPVGADCVVPIEKVEELADGRLRILDPESVQSGQYIHRMGSDRAAGEELIPVGTRLRIAEIGVAAATGLAELLVSVVPRVTLISTGDELVEPGLPIEPHQIRPSSTLALEAALIRWGAAPSRLHLTDDREEVRSGLEQALASSDVLISSGGVSKGDRDHLPSVLAELGVEPVLHRVGQRPGKPMWFGTRGDQAVFALPGNPVSTLVCFARYVLPALAHASGLAESASRRACLVEPIDFPAPLTFFCPVHLQSGEGGVLEARPRQTNTSGDFASLATTDGFLELPATQNRFEAGDAYPFWPW